MTDYVGVRSCIWNLADSWVILYYGKYDLESIVSYYHDITHLLSMFIYLFVMERCLDNLRRNFNYDQRLFKSQ